MLIVQEHKSDKYSPRTYFNAKSADVTVAFAVDLTTYGEILTYKAAGDNYIGFHLVEDSSPLDIARKLYAFMKKKNAKTLNVAGNGIYTLSKFGCSQEHINAFVCDVLEKVNSYWPIEKIYTGGQTGVDLAGAVVGVYLGIETLVTLPGGYKQRFENGKDISQTREEIEKQIYDGVKLLVSFDEKSKKNIKQNKI